MPEKILFGKNRKTTKNSNAKRLSQFGIENELTVANISYPHKNTHKPEVTSRNV